MKPTIQETQAEAIDALLTHSTSLASLGTKVGEKMIGKIETFAQSDVEAIQAPVTLEVTQGEFSALAASLALSSASISILATRLQAELSS